MTAEDFLKIYAANKGAPEHSGYDQAGFRPEDLIPFGAGATIPAASHGIASTVTGALGAAGPYVGPAFLAGLAGSHAIRETGSAKLRGVQKRTDAEATAQQAAYNANRLQRGLQPIDYSKASLLRQPAYLAAVKELQDRGGNSQTALNYADMIPHVAPMQLKEVPWSQHYQKAMGDMQDSYDTYMKYLDWKKQTGGKTSLTNSMPQSHYDNRGAMTTPRAGSYSPGVGFKPDVK